MLHTLLSPWFSLSPQHSHLNFSHALYITLTMVLSLSSTFPSRFLPCSIHYSHHGSLSLLNIPISISPMLYTLLSPWFSLSPQHSHLNFSHALYITLSMVLSLSSTFPSQFLPCSIHYSLRGSLSLSSTFPSQFLPCSIHYSLHGSLSLLNIPISISPMLYTLLSPWFSLSSTFPSRFLPCSIHYSHHGSLSLLNIPISISPMLYTLLSPWFSLSSTFPSRSLPCSIHYSHHGSLSLLNIPISISPMLHTLLSPWFSLSPQHSHLNFSHVLYITLTMVLSLSSTFPSWFLQCSIHYSHHGSLSLLNIPISISPMLYTLLSPWFSLSTQHSHIDFSHALYITLSMVLSLSSTFPSRFLPCSIHYSLRGSLSLLNIPISISPMLYTLLSPWFSLSPQHSHIDFSHALYITPLLHCLSYIANVNKRKVNNIDPRCIPTVTTNTCDNPCQLCPQTHHWC